MAVMVAKAMVIIICIAKEMAKEMVMEVVAMRMTFLLMENASGCLECCQCLTACLCLHVLSFD